MRGWIPAERMGTDRPGPEADLRRRRNSSVGGKMSVIYCNRIGCENVQCFESNGFWLKVPKPVMTCPKCRATRLKERCWMSKIYTCYRCRRRGTQLMSRTHLGLCMDCVGRMTKTQKKNWSFHGGEGLEKNWISILFKMWAEIYHSCSLKNYRMF